MHIKSLNSSVWVKNLQVIIHSDEYHTPTANSIKNPMHFGQTSPTSTLKLTELYYEWKTATDTQP